MQTKGPVVMATIDIGAHSVRMLIAEVSPDMSFEVLEYLEQRIPLGSDVFKNGRINNKDILLLCDIFRNFRRKMDEYDIKLYKAIATSAVREASNSDIFIERIEQASGIKVNIFEGIDGARLDYLTVNRDIPAKYGFNKKRMLIADIGTGACQVSAYENGNISFTETIRIGTLRILEVMPSTVSFAGMKQSLTPFVNKSFGELEHIAYSLKADGLVAMGSSVRAIALLAKGINHGEKALNITHKKFNEIYLTATQKSVEKIVRDYKISHGLAEAITPCCLIIDYLFRITGAEHLIVPMTSTKDALLLNFISQTFGEKDHFAPQIESIVKKLAEKYKCDNSYTQRTVLIAEILFSSLQELHGLGQRELFLLKIAARLHKAGLFINNQAYHKHSYYLINSSDIPGISRRGRQIVAAVARYHRKSFPKPAHFEYMALSPHERIVVNKLAAILRIACGLAEACSSEKHFKLRIKEDSVELKLLNSDISADKAYLEMDAGFFFHVFARRMIFI